MISRIGGIGVVHENRSFEPYFPNLGSGTLSLYDYGGHRHLTLTVAGQQFKGYDYASARHFVVRSRAIQYPFTTMMGSGYQLQPELAAILWLAHSSAPDYPPGTLT
jgi:hypothetical protein